MNKKKQIDVVALPDLTPEQIRLLRDQFQKEDAKTAAADSEQFVYSNPTRETQFVPDLGIKTGDHFHTESFAPGVTKNLAQTYRSREIKASKYLQILKDQGKLVKGPLVASQAAHDPFHELALMRPDGTFNDPLSGQRTYDLKLRELEDKEDRDHGIGRRITPRR